MPDRPKTQQVLISEDRTGRYEPAWSPDGTRLCVYTYYEPWAIGPAKPKVPCVYHVADLGSGKQEKLVDGSPRWQPAAQFSGDGKWVYFTALGQVHRSSTETPGSSEPITALTAFAANGQVSPDGKWLAFRRNDEIWVALLGLANRDQAGRDGVPAPLPFGRARFQLHA